MNSIIFIVMDSCRFDSFAAAKHPNIDRLGDAEKRFSYASWTAPSHYTYAMGLMPHKSPSGVMASEVYKDEFAHWRERCGVPEIAFRDFLPQLSLPKALKDLGYRTVAKVSMPVLNKYTALHHFFDDYKQMPHHNDFSGMVDEIDCEEDDPHFYFLNLGETHYPYMLSGEDLPRVSGLHGVLKDMDGDNAARLATAGVKDFFTPERFESLHQQQSKCVEYIDGLIGDVMDVVPKGTHFIVTADHGELFGEGGYFGHGPIMHEKCFEVPFVEGALH
jgi:hypothetical protein